METRREDAFKSCQQFDGWSCSSEHWDEDHKDSSNFGDWTSFKEGLSEDTADLLAQNSPNSDQEHKLENDIEPWMVIHHCFHIEERERDSGMMQVLPLTQLLHNSGHTPPTQAELLRKGASFYHRLMCEWKTSSSIGLKPNLYSHKLLTDTLQLQQTNLCSQNPDLPQFGFGEAESSSGALIQTKLTSSTRCQSAPRFFYQISQQWLNLRLQNQGSKLSLR